MDSGNLIWLIVRSMALIAAAYYGFVENYAAAMYYVALAIYAAVEVKDNG
jgi:hypothetical protein